MRPTLIDLNDVELRIARGVEELARSPGYATFVNPKVEIGETGFAHAWLLPRHSSNRYWQTLNTAPVTRMGKKVRHAGDLAYLHLADLRERGGRPDQAIFIVPGAYQRAQLSLLLGIAQATGLVVEALVDSAVAVGATLSPGHYTYVESLLHHTTIAQIAVDEQRAVRVSSEVVPEAGLSHFEQRIIACIVEALLKSCRFDVLHDAATEQLLHTHLAQWLALLAERPEIILSIEYHGTRHETRLQRAAVVAAIAPLRNMLVQRAGPGIVLLDYRLGRLPGITEGWSGAQLLPSNAALAGCAQSPDLQHLTGQGVGLRSELAVVPAPLLAPAPPTRATTVEPTHLLAQHVAYPLLTTPLHLTARGTAQRMSAADTVATVVLDIGGPRVDVAPGARLLLNGQAISGSAPLCPGDQLTIVGASHLFVPITVRADAL